MRRRDCFKLVGAAAAVLLMWPWGAEARTGRTGRLGLPESASQGLNSANFNALGTGSAGLERHNLVLICASAGAGAQRWQAPAAALPTLGVDPIVTPAVPAAKDASTKVPIVIAAGGEPLAVDEIALLARPGANITGPSAVATELTGKPVELPSMGLTAFIEKMGNLVLYQSAMVLGLPTPLIALAEGVSE